jgi:D-mannonate dehydratase
MNLTDALFLTPAWTKEDISYVKDMCAELKIDPEEYFTIPTLESWLNPAWSIPQDDGKIKNFNAVGLIQFTRPVAIEYKIRMACHPCDPWLPPGYRGVDRVLGGFEGFKRLIEICPSPYHGLNLCLGCMAESVEDPAREVPEIIRYFGQRKKIHLIHYRNIIGKRNKFQEVFQDNGVMNMHKIMQVMKEIEYPYMFVEDHEPSHPDDPGGRQSAAFQWGYMIAMLQAVNDEA